VSMLTVTKLAAVVAIVVAVALVFVLITPDPSDDVDAVLHLGKAFHSPGAGFASTLSVTSIENVAKHPYFATNACAKPALDLLCSCRC